MQNAEPQPRNIDDDFRDDLRVVIAVVTKLAPHCKSVEDLVGLCELGLKNEGQLDLLLNLVAPLSFRK